jgi:transcription termination factor Rho
MSHQVDSPIVEAGPAARPAPVSLNDLQALRFDALVEKSRSLGLRQRPEASRHHLVLDVSRALLAMGGEVTAVGLLETGGDHGVLRWPAFGLKPGPEDPFVHRDHVRALGLRPGVLLRCALKLSEGGDRGLAVAQVLAVEDIPAADWKTPPDFDKLTPVFPNRRVFLESPVDPDIAARAVDLVAPLGMGQRGIIAAPPRSGKTILLKALAKAIQTTHPDAELMILLVDERPEEVTDFRAELDCEIYSSTFDEPVTRHVQICDAVCERAKRLVELRRDVIILLDSITRMARGYNNQLTGKGRTMSGGVDAKALARPRKFFGSARNVEEGGSLTILATALIETYSRMDELIFEEFKATGNMEIYLDRQTAEQRIYPAIHIVKSGTRREELLYHPDEFERVQTLRRQLSDLPAGEAMETLVTNLRNTQNNAELLMAGLRGI